MPETLRVGRTGATVVLASGAIALAVFGVLCLELPVLRHGTGLEIWFAALGASACALISLRAFAVARERGAWLMFSLAIAANTATEVLELARPGPVTHAAGAVVGTATFPLAIGALVLMTRARLGRLRPIAWLDGMTGAVVVQTILAVVILAPAARHDAHLGHPDPLALLYPLADLLILGVVAAASAETGWRLNGWMSIGLGLGLITIGDSVWAAHGAHPAEWPAGIASVLWLAGVWALAVSAWAPVPARPDARADARGWVPVTLSLIALALLLFCTLHRDGWAVTIGLAVAGMVLVTGRFALTLRLNADVLKLARTEATTDSLTGLRNRRQLVRDLDLMLDGCSDARPCGIALFDLNGFKTYNDTYGHPAGDALLETLGNRLAAALDGSATAYRLGGDEFCVLIGAEAESLHGIIARAGEALTVSTREQTVTNACGVALLPRDASTPEEALRLADLRMYESKNRGRIGPARQVTQTLMLALEERNLGLPSELSGIGELAVATAERLGLPPAERERTQLAALLRNVGKIAIPDSVLTKPGPLTAAERRLMRRHPLVGQRIVEAAPALLDVGKLVRATHERIDGAGYPDGLAGNEIPLGARIVAVCSSYDAMISARAYRPALSHEQAVDELRRSAGSQFDPEVVEAFVQVISTGDPPPEISPRDWRRSGVTVSPVPGRLSKQPR
jgi:two-component system, cell cycle response regulator